ncbi:hypothetical protein PENSUB_1452 [Penicillium subrubescens]|uniref:Uncharacterized protein n=1 Tax=Penicillium subrubescens TaxID=1316194 RepID=A0A1Q5UK93_9EURO|nr:hypothetical protein PENSUB_1452 [Penicillium subrubescens]
MTSFYWHNLPNFFWPIAPDRRQFYANFVEKALLPAVMNENDDDSGTLQDLVFPKLRSLHLFVNFGHNYIPRIPGHRIEELKADSQHEKYPTTTVDPEAMSAILDQIPVYAFRGTE